jgi:phage protein U
MNSENTKTGEKSKLLKIGKFSFMTNGVSYDKLSFAHTHKWEEVKKADASSSSLQYVGHNKTASINGVILPTEGRGDVTTIEALNKLGGKPQKVVTGSGKNLGDWVITQINESFDKVFEDGTPRKITYNLSLKYFGESK